MINRGRQTATFARSPLSPVTFTSPAAARPLAPCLQAARLAPLNRKLLPHLRPFSTSNTPNSRGPVAAQSPKGRADPEESLPFTEYTPEANSAYWTTRPVSVVKRLLQVSSALGSWITAGVFGSSVKELRAEHLRHILSDLGPAYVKIGQAVSSRPDVLPPEFLGELEKLQDRLPPFSTEQALRLIEEELGCPVSDVFSYISDRPVAAASLGQVYRGVLRSTGADVAIKVQRPGVATSIALDVLILRRLAGQVRRWRKLNTDLQSLIDEWAASLFKELDYRAEAANGVKFKELYSHLEGVFVPGMNTDITTRRVLVMEWVDGVRLRTAYASTRDAAEVVSVGGGASGEGDTPLHRESGSQDDLRLVEVGVRCSLEQLLEYGFYHADPHPGNLLRTKDGQLAYLDFGMMGQVDESIRRGLIRATLHLVNREYAALAEDFVTLGMLPPDADRSAIIPALTSVFSKALAGGVNNLSFGDLSSNLGRTMYQFKFQIPGYYTLLVRSLSVLEGIALASSPDYKVLGAAYPWVARRLLTDTSEELRGTLLSLLYKEDGKKFNFKRMESLLVQAAQPTGRPQPRRDDPHGSGPPRGDALALVLSPQGEFIRGIIVEEIAKGADAAWRIAADSAVHSIVGEIQGAATTGGGGGPQSMASSFPLLYSLLDVLAAVPALADEDDAEQVEGMRRLSIALQQSTAAQREQEQERQQRGWSSTAQSMWMQDGGGTSEKSRTTNASSPKEEQASEDPCTSILENLEAASSLLQWALKEAETLGPAERAEALRLPLEIGQAVASRVAARIARWLLVAQSGSEESTGNHSRGRAERSGA